MKNDDRRANDSSARRRVSKPVTTMTDLETDQAHTDTKPRSVILHERLPGTRGITIGREAKHELPSSDSAAAESEDGRREVVLIKGASPTPADTASSRNVVVQEAHDLLQALGERPYAPRPRLRPWRLTAVACLFMLLSFTAVFVDRAPLGRMAATQARDGDLDLALQTLTHPGLAHQPTGPWDATAGGIELGQGGGAGPGVQAPGSAGLPTTQQSAGSATPATAATPSPTVRPVATPTKTVSPKPTPTKASGGSGTGGSSSGTGVSPAPLSPWPPTNPWLAPPGYKSFRVKLPANSYYWWAFGQCTWWAQYQRQDENLRRMGNAEYWAAGAKKRGYAVGTTPRKGATAVFQPGVEGAGGAGHVAHVVAVYPGGWFLVSEMNFYWNGGGWGRVEYRYAYARSGVSFIY